MEAEEKKIEEQDAAEKEAPEASTEEENEAEQTCPKEGSPSRKERKEIKALKGEIEQLTASLAESEDKYKRMIAEYDNFRKRSAKEREGIYADAYADLLGQILPVKDALEMAVAYETEGEGKVLAGVKMTLAKFAEALERVGVEEIGAVGDTFDPNLHNAVMHVEDESLGEGVISQVMLKGYRKGDRILRFAMVCVAN